MPSPAGDARPDVAVVGGGVLGQSVALECARQGLRVTLVYPRGHGVDSATLAAGAMIGAFGELDEAVLDEVEERKLAFRARSQDLHEAWLAGLRDDAGLPIHTVGGMFMVANRGGSKDVARLTDIKAHLDRYGRRNGWVDPADVPGLQPHARYPAVKALFIDDDFTVDSRQLLLALARAAERTGRVAVVHDRVSGLRQDPAGGTWWLRTRRHGQIEVPIVAVCSGARVPAVLGDDVLAAVKLPTLFFAKGIGVVVSGPPPIPHAIRTPNREDACGLHVVPRADGRLYIGASNHYGYAPAAARGVTPGEISAILGYTIREINGALRDTTIESVRFGLRPLSSDGAPLLGRTRLAGLFLATGTFRTGIVMAPLIAQVVVGEITGRAAEGTNPFRADGGRRAKPDYLNGVDLNAANVYADRGLQEYWRASSANGGGASHAAQALRAWRTYVELAGTKVDRRIVTLMHELEAGSRGAAGDGP